MPASTQSQQFLTRMSEALSFSVSDIPGDNANKAIHFSFSDSKNQYTHLMLVMFTSPDGVPIEMEMKPLFDGKDNKIFHCELTRPLDARDKFFFVPNVKPEDKMEAKQSQKPFGEGVLDLKKGILQTWLNENLTAPKGTLQKFLYRKDGSLSDPVDAKELQKEEKIITVYLPPGYDNNKKPPYRLQVVLDGDQFLNSMHMDTILNNLAAENKIEPTVTLFVSPYMGPPRPGLPGFFPVTPPGYSLSERFDRLGCNLQTDEELCELVHLMRGTFNVDNQPQNTILRGFSMGGMQSIYTAIHHPDIFGNVIAQSPSTWWGPPTPGQPVNSEIDATWRALKEEKDRQEYLRRIIESGKDERFKEVSHSQPINFYLQAGTDETAAHLQGEFPLRESTQRLATALMQKGHHVIGNQVHLHQGGHLEIHARCGIADAEMAVNTPRLDKANEKKVSPLSRTNLFYPRANQTNMAKVKQDMSEEQNMSRDQEVAKKYWVQRRFRIDPLNINAGKHIVNKMKNLATDFTRSDPLEVCSIYAAIHENALKRNINLRHFSLYKQEKPIASITLSLNNDIARIDDVGTSPEFQRKGYATHLMRYVLSEAKSLGARHCFLESSDSGLGIYQNLGFEPLFKNNIYSRKA